MVGAHPDPVTTGELLEVVHRPATRVHGVPGHQRRTGPGPGLRPVGPPAEHLLDLLLVSRMGDQIGRVIDPAPKATDHVAVCLAESVRDALVGIGTEQLGDRGRRLDPRRRQLDRPECDRLLDPIAAEPELLANPRSGCLQLRPCGLALLVPPAPVLAPAGSRLYQ